ncbi:hypothetical protein Krac_5134 [Ktedonobacter racemifer DSM 44963]|uniref:Uncharacterized protein n=1 Tax=Ktedonobacter racemifer DSM 44963 TaxID=485913 RepID=D6TUP6_KTERA|nr:hypothetical protein Krac_5134 [Ktedonobacter racemifer DSM 44963]
MKPGWDYPHSRQTTEGQQDWFPMKARVSMSSLIIIVAIVYLSLFHAEDCVKQSFFAMDTVHICNVSRG